VRGPDSRSNRQGNDGVGLDDALMAQKARESAKSLLLALKMTLPTKGIGKEARKEDETKEKADGHAINGSAS
jgi:hypothetical protein